MANNGQLERVGQMGRSRRVTPGGRVRRAGRKGALILLLAIAGGATVLWAQSPVLPASATVAATPVATEVDPGSVRLLVGRSTVLDVGTPITRVSLTSPDIADALVTSPEQLLIHGKTPGTISMFVWGRGGGLRRYEISVQRDLARLSEQMRELFPAEHIDVQSNGKNVVLSGTVTNKDAIDKAVNVAAGYVDKREEIVTLLQLQTGAPSNQVLLRVRFAEVSRSALTELGASFFTSGRGIENNIGRVTTQQFPAPNFEDLTSSKIEPNWQKFGSPVTSADGKLTFSDFLNFFLFNEKYDLGVMIKALQTRGLFQSLAEPNLVAESGKEASFLAGGEFPIPVVQGAAGNLGVTVIFKEFGVRLNFTPTVNGNRISLKVKPEVSTLDFNNAIVLNGFRIPALTTRRTETELELENHQTFAIAGLMNNTVVSTLSKVPGIGDIPILGYLFKSKAAQKNQTELVVMITPEILANGSNGLTPNLPRTPEPFLPALPNNRTVPAPPAAFGGDAPAANRRPAVASVSSPAPAQPTAAANAAAAVSALAPAAGPSVQPAPASSAPSASAPAPVGSRQPTDQERKELDRVHREDEQRAKEKAKVDERIRAEEAKRQAAQAVIDRRKASEEKVRQEQAAREQAKRDAETARRNEDAARKQLQRQREQQKSIDEATARLKAAQAAYEAELAKKNKQ